MSNGRFLFVGSLAMPALPKTRQALLEHYWRRQAWPVSAYALLQLSSWPSSCLSRKGIRALMPKSEDWWASKCVPCAACKLLRGAVAGAGPASPGLPSQDAGAQALLQLSLLDRQPPAEQEQRALVPKQEPGKGEGSQRQAIMAMFRRVQTFVSIVEIDADTLKRKKIRQYMQSARAGLEELVDMWATGSAMPE